MNYLRKPTQGKGFAVVTLTKPKSGTISRGPIDVYRSAIAPKKPSPSRAQRDARSAYKIDRDAAGGVVDLVRLSGAKEHRFSRSDRPLWLAPPASSARRSAPSTGCGWKHLPPPPSARARACAAGFSRSAVAPSRFAIRRVVTVRIQIITLSHNQSACTLVGLVLSPASGGSRENRIWMQRLVSSPPARARALRRRLPSARHCAVALCDPQGSTGSGCHPST